MREEVGNICIPQTLASNDAELRMAKQFYVYPSLGGLPGSCTDRGASERSSYSCTEMPSSQYRLSAAAKVLG